MDLFQLHWTLTGSCVLCFQTDKWVTDLKNYEKILINSILVTQKNIKLYNTTNNCRKVKLETSDSLDVEKFFTSKAKPYSFCLYDGSETERLKRVTQAATKTVRCDTYSECLNIILQEKDEHLISRTIRKRNHTSYLQSINKGRLWAIDDEMK